jgi:predicted transcriptional regulator
MAEREERLQLAADIVSAHASNNTRPADQLPGLIQQVYRALATARSPLKS